jgi:hypothetical protein
MLTCYLTGRFVGFYSFSLTSFHLLTALLTGYFIGWGRAVAQ